MLCDLESLGMHAATDDADSGGEMTTLQRVLRKVYGRTKGVSTTQSLA